MISSPRWAISADGSTVDALVYRPRALTLSGVRHSADIFRLWSIEQLRAVGVYPIASADPPAGHRVLSRTFQRVGDAFVEGLETEPPAIAEQGDANAALSAVQFFDALAAEPAIDRTEMGVDVKAWLRSLILASSLDSALKIAALNRLESATRYLRRDPSAPGLIEAIAALLPRADGSGVGLDSSEIDALFQRGATLVGASP